MLVPRSRKCIFLWYKSSVKGINCSVLRQKNVVVNKYVVFNELEGWNYSTHMKLEIGSGEQSKASK